MNPNYESDINIIDIDNPEFKSSVPFVSAEQDAYCLAKASSDQCNESYGSWWQVDIMTVDSSIIENIVSEQRNYCLVSVSPDQRKDVSTRSYL